MIESAEFGDARPSHDACLGVNGASHASLRCRCEEFPSLADFQPRIPAQGLPAGTECIDPHDIHGFGMELRQVFILPDQLFENNVAAVSPWLRFCMQLSFFQQFFKQRLQIRIRLDRYLPDADPDICIQGLLHENSMSADKIGEYFVILFICDPDDLPLIESFHQLVSGILVIEDFLSQLEIIQMTEIRKAVHKADVFAFFFIRFILKAVVEPFLRRHPVYPVTVNRSLQIPVGLIPQKIRHAFRDRSLH